jgi:Integrase core domain
MVCYLKRACSVGAVHKLAQRSSMSIQAGCRANAYSIRIPVVWASAYVFGTTLCSARHPQRANDADAMTGSPIGDVWDNSAIESFFSSLKTERCNRKVYSTRDQAKADVFDYIERFYNTRRRHSTIGYLSPVEFEHSMGKA